MHILINHAILTVLFQKRIENGRVARERRRSEDESVDYSRKMWRKNCDNRKEVGVAITIDRSLVFIVRLFSLKTRT